MPARPILALLPPLLVLAAAAVGRGDDVRYYEQDGVTYCETKRVVHRPISETHYEDQQRTAYVEQYQTQMQSTPRTYQIPVTECSWEPYWVNRWNPFAQAYIAYRYVPRVRWEVHTDTVQTPVTVRTLAPLQQTVKVPVTTQRMADEEQISRVAVSIRPNTAPGATNTATAAAPGADPFAQGTSSVARREAAGGTPLESDPPRDGTAWHAADPGVQR